MRCGESSEVESLRGLALTGAILVLLCVIASGCDTDPRSAHERAVSICVEQATAGISDARAIALTKKACERQVTGAEQSGTQQ